MREFKQFEEKYRTMFSLPDNVKQKLICFEFLTLLFIDWYRTVSKTEKTAEEHLGKLTLMKLLFFTSAVGSSKNGNVGLLDIFDNFYAVPYGAIENDVYNNLTHINCFTFKSNGIIEFKQPNVGYFDKISPETKQRLHDAVDRLKKENNEFVLLCAVDLVDLNQQWYSWQSSYKLAQSMNKNTIKIPNGLILGEHKFYSLS
jgi:hypothetical protein